jgi:hypothetical protein
MEEVEKDQQNYEDVYPSRLLDGRVYKEVTQRTIEIAFKSYETARYLNIISFAIGIILLIIAIIFAFAYNDKAWLSVAFAAFGTADLIALLVIRPLESIQLGVNELVKSQIACLDFAASYESLARFLIASSQLPFDDKNRDMQAEFERAKYLMDAAFQFTSAQQSTHVKKN